MMIKFINILTLSRMVIGVLIFGILVSESNYLIAFILFFVAGATDYLDGYLARKFNALSQIGEILDPIADKILILFLLFGLALNLSSNLIGFAGAIIIAREIWVSALRDFNGRNNNNNATKVTYIAKVKTSMQLFTIGTYLFGLATKIMLLIVLADILLIISLLITVYTGYQYTRQTFHN